MAPEDLVIDTNVFLHAENSGSKHFVDSLALIEWFQNSQIVLCVDDDGLIIAEYGTQFRPLSLGLSVLAMLVSKSRIRYVPHKLSTGDRHWLIVRVPDARDKTFVGVAFHSTNKVLVSNDLKDFTPKTRREVGNRFNVSILLADEMAA